jgi:RNA polymerase sigma factor (sigma-70 family)
VGAELVASPAFPATRLSVLAGLRSTSEKAQTEAQDQVSRIYWNPVYRHLRLKWRKDPEAARDLTQEFFAMALEKESLESYDPDKGRFRAYLKTCLDRFALNEARAERRLKRGGGEAHFDFASIEAELAKEEPTPEEQLDAEFDRALASSLLDVGVQDLERQLCDRGKTVHYALFSRYVLSDEEERPTYSTLANELGIKESDVTNHLAYARREFRRIVLDHLRLLTTSEEEFDLEVRAVLGAGAFG